MGRKINIYRDEDKANAVKISPIGNKMLNQMVREGAGKTKAELMDRAIKWFYLSFAPTSPLVVNDPQSETGNDVS